jgi:hypothetical protein
VIKTTTAMTTAKKGDGN